MSKPKAKISEKMSSIRIKTDTKKLAKEKLVAANKKGFGRTIKFPELIELAVSRLSDEDLKLLQERSMTNADRKEILRQKYIESRGPITEDQFTGFMMTAEFQEFLRAQDSVGPVARAC